MRGCPPTLVAVRPEAASRLSVGSGRPLWLRLKRSPRFSPISLVDRGFWPRVVVGGLCLSSPMTTAAADYSGVEDLDPAGVLDALRGEEVVRRRAELNQLLLALHWCLLHPATADTGVACWGHPALPGHLDADESLGGPGTPKVAAFTPEPFAAALGVSTMSGMALLADALDLRHRLPAIWARVQSLEVPAWKARRVAQATHALSLEAAGYVDARLAGRPASAGARGVGAPGARAPP